MYKNRNRAIVALKLLTLFEHIKKLKRHRSGSDRSGSKALVVTWGLDVLQRTLHDDDDNDV